jgi:hypothetical protein
MAQQAESASSCVTCHHRREAHVEWMTAGHSSLPQLREHCQVMGCTCQFYVGILWEAPHAV